MEKFIEDITTAYWWMAVVIVGIIINVASTYIRSGIENQLAKISTYWSTRKELRENNRAQLINLLQEDSQALVLYAKTESRHRLQAIQNTIFSFIFIFMAASSVDMVIFDELPMINKLISMLILMSIALLSLMGAVSSQLESSKVKNNIKVAFPRSELFNS